MNWQQMDMAEKVCTIFVAIAVAYFVASIIIWVLR